MSSTFWSERLGPAAAIKTLEIMEKDKTWITITKLGNRLINIWKKLAKRHKLKLTILGIPALAKFSINSKIWAYKTYISQQMLEKGFSFKRCIFINFPQSHYFQRYENLLDKIFFNISCVKKAQNQLKKF